MKNEPILQVCVWSSALVLLQCALHARMSILIIPHVALQVSNLEHRKAKRIIAEFLHNDHDINSGVSALLLSIRCRRPCHLCSDRRQNVGAQLEIHRYLNSSFVNVPSNGNAVVAIASFGLLLALLIAFNFAFIVVCFHAYNHIRREECTKKSTRMSDSTSTHEPCCSCCV